MKPTRFRDLFVVLAAATSVLFPQVQAQGAGMVAVSAQQIGPQGQSGGEPQEPGELRLAERERVGQEGKRFRVGNTEFLATDIFDFTGVANDLFFWGWLPTVSGEVADNAFLGGQTIDIADRAAIGGDLFAIGQTVDIEGHIGGDVYTFANDLRIAAAATLDGALYGGSAIASIDGVIGGPVNLAAGSVVINGTIRGDVTIECGELELGPNVVIEGELRYESARQATIDPGARVSGEIRHVIPQEDDPDDEGEPWPASRPWFSFWGFLWNVWWWLSSFLVGAIALAVGGEKACRPASRLAEQPALGLGLGFVVASVFPAAAILSMILLVTIPLGLIGLSLYLAAVYVARLVAAQAVGNWLLRTVLGGAESSSYASLALGLLLFALLAEIPYVSFLIWLAAVVSGLGGIFLAMRGASVAAPPGALGAQSATTP